MSNSLFQLTTLSLDQSLSVLVQMQLGDDDFRWVQVQLNRSTVGLFLGDLVDLNGELQSVNAGDLTLLTLVGTTGDQDFVISSDRQGSDTVLSSQFLGERSGQQDTTLGRWSGEVSLSGLSSVRGNVCDKDSLLVRLFHYSNTSTSTTVVSKRFIRACHDCLPCVRTVIFHHSFPLLQHT